MSIYARFRAAVRGTERESVALEGKASGFASLLSIRMKFRASDLALAHGKDVRVGHHLYLYAGLFTAAALPAKDTDLVAGVDELIDSCLVVVPNTTPAL